MKVTRGNSLIPMEYLSVECAFAHNNVTSSAKRDLIAEETVSSYISCFYTFAIVFFIKTTQGARKMFSLDAH